MLKATLNRWLGRVRASTPAAATPPRAVERPRPDWIAGQLARPITYVLTDGAAIAALARRWPARTQAVIAAAERAVAHEFELLGSGPFQPVDPDRPRRDDYTPIDWYLDPVRQLRFPRGIPHKEWNLYEMRPANADIKYPWELARCYHWATLGQAWRLTNDERFAREIINQLDDFMEANPVGVGVNWTCTMDVGIRAVNWTLALDLIRGSASADAASVTRAYLALFEHGVFIRNNLENTYEVTSNHFLSNVLGLWFLGSMFAEHPEGAAWVAFAQRALEEEIDVQVLPDGADFESSVPYHRLVTELFLGALRLGDATDRPLSERYRARVRDMASYLADVTRPDGLMPQSGDADDGRLHVLTGVAAITPQDARHLLGPAGVLFDRPEWVDAGGEAASWEAAWWGLALQSPPAGTPRDAARLYPDAGHAVCRHGGHYLLVTNSVVGTRGFGNHKHNDQLSFEYHVGGRPLVVDPGSYVYTSDPAARNLFRSTRYHNTVSVDEIEQNEFNPEWLFRMFEKARAEHLAFSAEEGQVRYHGRHHGYTRLADPVVHDRRFAFDAIRGTLDIVDSLRGAAEHRLLWHFHFAPGVSLKLGAPNACVARTDRGAVQLTWTGDLAPRIVDTFYSPSYGVKHACQSLELLITCDLGVSDEWRFAFRPEVAA